MNVEVGEDHTHLQMSKCMVARLGIHDELLEGSSKFLAQKKTPEILVKGFGDLGELVRVVVMPGMHAETRACHSEGFPEIWAIVTAQTEMGHCRQDFGNKLNKFFFLPRWLAQIDDRLARPVLSLLSRVKPDKGRTQKYANNDSYCCSYSTVSDGG